MDFLEDLDADGVGMDDFLGAIPADPVPTSHLGEMAEALDWDAVGSVNDDGDSSEKLTLTTPNHLIRLSHACERMAAQDDLCDVELALCSPTADPVVIPMHSLVVCACSPVLRALLTHQPLPGATPAPTSTTGTSNSSSSSGRLGASHSPSAHSANGDTDAYESSTCSSKESSGLMALGEAGPEAVRRHHLQLQQQLLQQQQQAAGSGSSAQLFKGSIVRVVPSPTGTRLTSPGIAPVARLRVELEHAFLDEATVHIVRTYMYTGILRCSPDGMPRLLETALLLEVQVLVELAAGFLAANLRQEQVFEAARLAGAHGLRALSERASELMLAQFDELVAQPEWAALPASSVRAVLGSDELATASEMRVFMALATWAGRDREARMAEFLQMAGDADCMRLSNMTRDELLEMSQHPLVAASKELRRALYDEGMQRVAAQRKSTDGGAGAVPAREPSRARRYAHLSPTMAIPPSQQEQQQVAQQQQQQFQQHQHHQQLQQQFHLAQSASAASHMPGGKFGAAFDNGLSRSLPAPHHHQPAYVNRAHASDPQPDPPLRITRCERILSGFQDPVCALALTSNGCVAAASGAVIFVYRADTWEQVATLQGHESAVVSLRALPGLLVSASPDRTVRVWSVDSWSCVHVLPTPKASVCTMAVQQGKLVTGGDDGTLKSWAIGGAWSLMRTFQAHQHVIWALASYGDDTIITGSSDTTIKIWTVFPNGAFQAERTLPCHKDEVQALAVDARRHWLLSCSDDGCINIHDCRSWTLLRSISWHNRAVLSLASCGGSVAAGLGNGVVGVWDKDAMLHSDEAVVSLSEHTSCVMALLSVNGRLVTASFDHTMRIWGP